MSKRESALASLKRLRERVEREADDCPTNYMQRIQGSVLLGWIETLRRIERQLTEPCSD